MFEYETLTDRQISNLTADDMPAIGENATDADVVRFCRFAASHGYEVARDGYDRVQIARNGEWIEDAEWADLLRAAFAD